MLQLGESHTVTYTMTTSEQGHSASMQVSQTTRFVSLDTVTVPAGTFKQACHFQSTFTSSGHGQPTSRSASDVWYGAGTGVIIKSSDANVEQQLTSGTINGVAVH